MTGFVNPEISDLKTSPKNASHDVRLTFCYTGFMTGQTLKIPFLKKKEFFIKMKYFFLVNNFFH